MNGVSERIEALRQTSVKTDIEVAELLGLSIYEYGDLESYDNEIIDVVSVKTATHLAGLYNQSLLQLLVPELENRPKTHLSEVQLAEDTKAKILKEGLSSEDADDAVGWYLKGFLDSPKEYIAENPIMFLMDLSRFLGINWLCTISNDIHS